MGTAFQTLLPGNQLNGPRDGNMVYITRYMTLYMDTLFTLPAICAENAPATGGFNTQSPEFGSHG